MKTILTMLLLTVPLLINSQSREMISLWPGKVPGEAKVKALPVTDRSKSDGVLRYNEVTDPTLEVWLPEKGRSNGASMIVCPGGGYNILAYDKEGTEVAAWLNKQGFTAFVLSYRVPQKRDGALQDAQRALRIVRSKASAYGIDPEKTGIMGFSAGGSLSARTATGFRNRTYKPVDSADSLSCRPSFFMLIYPAYLDQGENHTLTPELNMLKDIPPAFIFQTADDPYGNSALVMAGALRDAKIPVELHLYQSGGHGYGLRPGIAAAEVWPVLAEEWLKKIVKTNP